MYVLIFLFAIALDQITKIWAINNLKGQSEIVVLNKWLHFTYVENSGAAWGIFQQGTIILVFLTLVICFGIIYYLIKFNDTINNYVKIPLIFILAGAIGNLIDRIRLGYVIDFIFSPLGGLYDFPVFNFADIYVSLAAIFLIIYMFFIEGKNVQE